jgi:hypothetical protein
MHGVQKCYALDFGGFISIGIQIPKGEWIMQAERFMSNIDDRYWSAILNAARITGAAIKVKPDAHTESGYLLPGHFSVYATSNNGYSAFWECFAELKQTT